jgi:methylmalonyl-CoA mutase N-terminal domain/subunit
MRFHCQTAGSTLTAQQPLNNVVRTTLQALAAVLGGTQSLHTNSFDEALGLPTESSALLALRTQQIIAHESGVAVTVDPLAGSYYLEALTDALEAKATELLEAVEAMGGAVAAIESGWMQARIDEAAYQAARSQESGESVVVGVNRFRDDQRQHIGILKIDPALEAGQKQRLARWREQRDGIAVRDALLAISAVASSEGNLLDPISVALKAGATLGEVSDALRRVFGVHGGMPR